MNHNDSFSQINLMEDPEILDKGDNEIDAERYAPVVNSSFNPFAVPSQNRTFYNNKGQSLDNIPMLKQIMRKSGFNP
jgi:hypothetical protein